ncbi:hypothetical protein D3C87_1844620 [compost metagenome]
MATRDLHDDAERLAPPMSLGAQGRLSLKQGDPDPDQLLLGAGQQLKGRGKRGDGGHQLFEGFVIAFKGGFARRDQLREAGFPCHHAFKIRAVEREGQVSLFRLLPLDGGQR